MLTRIRLLSIGLYLFVSSCSKPDSERINLPFLPNGDIVAHKLLDFQTEPAGITGHQQFFILWGLDSPTQHIDAATSSNVVHNNLYWLGGRNDQLNRSLEFFEAYRDYGKIKPDIVEILSDGDFKYAYTKLDISPSGVVDVSMWICSAKAKKIAFLSAY